MLMIQSLIPAQANIQNFSCSSFTVPHSHSLGVLLCCLLKYWNDFFVLLKAVYSLSCRETWENFLIILSDSSAMQSN